MRRSPLDLFVASLLSAILVGCASDSATPIEASQSIEPTQLPTALLNTETPTHTNVYPSTPSNEPTKWATPTPTHVSLGDPPPLPDDFPGDFLFGVGTPECQLPCWHNLAVDVSSKEEVWAVLDMVLGLDGFRPFPPDHILQELPGSLDAISYGTLLETSAESGSLGITAYFDKNSGILKGLSFAWLGLTRFQPNMTIERILRKLGEPSDIFVNSRIAGPGDAPNAEIRTIILYEAGLAFYRFEQAPISEFERAANGKFESVTTNLCIGNNYAHSNGTAIITAPLTNGLEDLSDLQDLLLSELIQGATPIEEITNVTLQEITELAIQQNNACIPLDLVQFQP